MEIHSAPRLPLATLLADKAINHSAVTCPNCWHAFLPESSLWISVHRDLADERDLPRNVLGESPQRRFIPERFDPEGRAVDPGGAACTQVACPRCKLHIPRASLEMPNVGLSILGSPGSGKSVYLTSMIFSLRQLAPRLGLKLQDADLSLNKHLVDDERKMFLAAEADSYRPIGEAVGKTQPSDQRYRIARVDGHDASFVMPYTFLIGPAMGHPQSDNRRGLTRMLSLYDNAGEHFLPDVDDARRPMTRHLAASKGLIFVFDPTKDRRVLAKLGPGTRPSSAIDRQDIILIEAANRIREHAGLSQEDPISQPLVIALTKYDAWRTLLKDLSGTGWTRRSADGGIELLDVNAVDQVSRECREFLRIHCGELVTAADSVSRNVTFVPVAAVGWDVRDEATTRLPAFRGADCEPFGVVVPLLSLLSKAIPEIVPSYRRRPG